jgi:hypothetical protein
MIEKIAVREEKRMKKYIYVIVLILFFTVGCDNEEINQQVLISEYVKNNQEILTKKIDQLKLLDEIDEDIVISQLPNDIKISNVYKSDARKYIDFSVDEGFTSSSHYYGFYYSFINEPITIMAISGEKEFFQEGYRIQESGNEDWYYTEKIIDNYYYYEAHY